MLLRLKDLPFYMGEYGAGMSKPSRRGLEPAGQVNDRDGRGGDGPWERDDGCRAHEQERKALPEKRPENEIEDLGETENGSRFTTGAYEVDLSRRRRRQNG